MAVHDADKVIYFCDMPAAKETTLKFYDDIKDEYKRLFNHTKYGVRVYTQEYICAELACKYYRSPKTIENIVFDRA